MSRFTAPKGKIVRRFGVNIYGNPKFDRMLAKKPHGPGMHGATQQRRKISEYATQLLEKQKLKYTYGLGEKQFRIVYFRALNSAGITGDNMMILLESRLDNVIYRLGLAPTRDAAKQMTTHGHVKVNGRRVNIPSFSVKPGDVVTTKESTKSKNLVRRGLEESTSREVPGWLYIDKDNLGGQVLRLPMREEIPSIANERLVVELYSK